MVSGGYSPKCIKTFKKTSPTENIILTQKVADISANGNNNSAVDIWGP